jgi:uncharacterized protein HemX
MCISAGTAALIAAGAAAATTVYSTEQGRKNASKQRDSVLRQQADADATAAQTSNNRLAMRRRALSQSSLATGADVMSTGMLNGGKPTLGG